VEIEIKLRLPPDSRELIERHPGLCAAPVDEQQQVTTYFDTTDLALSRQGMSLRVRRSGTTLIQTAKSLGDGRDAAFRRGEWEHPVTSERPDLAALAGTPLAKALHGIDTAGLRPMYVSDIRRSARIVQLESGTTVDVAIDQGAIRAGDRSEHVSELELELKQGELGALYRLALDLLGTAPLSLETASKAERGFLLRVGEPPKASKAADVDFASEVSGATAFAMILRSILSHLVANIAPARIGDPEGVHQLRVSIRRMRAALVLFRPRLQRDTVRRFGDELRRVGLVLGAARDWDVFLGETLSAAENHGAAGWLEKLRSGAELRQAAAHAELRREVDGVAFTALVLSLAGWVEDGARDAALLGGNALNRAIGELAPALLARLHRKVIKRGRHLETASRAELHALRKSVKKLRYGIEFLEPLASPKRSKSLLHACKDLQELLGRVNDAAVTPALASELGGSERPDLVPAIGRLASWADERGDKARGEVSKAWRKLQEAEPVLEQ
jgi:triphosphatase